MGLGDWWNAAKGGIEKYGGAFGDMLTGGAEGQHAAYGNAEMNAKVNEAAIEKFYRDQQAKAEGYYQPLQHMFSSAYGTEGMQAPEMPKSTGKPLAGMYGGK